jgi:hypothetical protein
MNKRTFLSMLACSLPAVALAGCGSSEEAQDSMGSVLEAVTKLEVIADEFDSKDWREVVPDVRNAIAELRSSVDNLHMHLR